MIEGINSFLKNWITSNEGFGCRSFYGETFSLAFFAKQGTLDNHLREILTKQFDQIDRTRPEFHWEFNRYALEQYREISGDTHFDSFLQSGTFKGTSCTNWTLLRNRLEYNAEEVKTLLEKRQLPNGLIQDDPGVHSFQYHCFSLALLIEIYENEEDSFLLESFEKGINFIRSMILSNGDTLYVGRGQQQIFGYASLIYALSKATVHLNDPTIFSDLQKVIHFLESFQRNDGSLPLVLRHEEIEIPKQVDLKNTQFLGWYAYNNYFDYLPFAGFFLAKAAEVLVNENKLESIPKELFDGCFQKVVRPGYEAILAKPTGYFSNDLPFPYLVSGHETLTPAYGGEQFGDSLFSIQDLPLPYFPQWKRTMRWKSRTIFQPNRLIMISPMGVMVRNFSFESDHIDISTRVYTPFQVKQQYLFFDTITQSNSCCLTDARITIESSKPLEYERLAYSASGPLKVFSSDAKFHQIKLKVHA